MIRGSIILRVLVVTVVAASARAGDDDDLLNLFSPTPEVHEIPEFAQRDSSKQFIVIASDIPVATEAEAIAIARKLAIHNVSALIVELIRSKPVSHSISTASEAEVARVVRSLVSKSPLESQTVIRTVDRGYGRLYRAILLVDVSEKRIAELASKTRLELRRLEEQRARTFTFRAIAYSGSILSPIVIFAVLNRLTRGYVTHILAPAGAAVALAGVTGTYLLM